MTCTGRIKPGTRCMQDRSFFRWPLDGVDPNQRFVFKPNHNGVDARADGFGLPGRYGNGAIFIYPTPLPGTS